MERGVFFKLQSCLPNNEKGERERVRGSRDEGKPPLRGFLLPSLLYTHGGPMLLKTDAGGNSEACCYCGLFLNQRLNSAPNTHTQCLAQR